MAYDAGKEPGDVFRVTEREPPSQNAGYMRAPAFPRIGEGGFLAQSGASENHPKAEDMRRILRSLHRSWQILREHHVRDSSPPQAPRNGLVGRDTSRPRRDPRRPMGVPARAYPIESNEERPRRMQGPLRP